jgi:hypothetical protein
MAISGTITLGTQTTTNITSFDLYPCTSSSNSSCSGTAFETNVSRASLLAGFQSTSIPDGTFYIKINANSGTCKDVNPAIVELVGVPVVSQTPTKTPTPTPTYTPTSTPPSLPIGSTLISLSSGYTIADACTGTTQSYYYQTPNPPTIPSFGYDGKQIYTDPDLLTAAPGNNNRTVYYYSSDYNTVYYVSDSEGRKYDTHTPCPTPTPTTGSVVNAVVSLVDGITACDGGDYGDAPSYNPLVDPLFFTLTIYGSNIVNASAIINIPSTLLADFTTNQEFYVRGRSSGTFYWKKFVLDGSPSAGATATSSGSAVQCV